MKINAGKCPLLVSTKSRVFKNVEESIIKNNNEEKNFSIKIDTELPFENHASSLCEKC